MTTLIKPFIVASISENTNSFGLAGHILIARDGEAWEVGRSPYGSEPWTRGQILHIELQPDGVPRWACYQCEIPHRLAVDAPPNVVAEVWGDNLTENQT